MVSIARASELSGGVRAESLSDGARASRPLADVAGGTDHEDEYRLRMRVNFFAAIVIIALMGAGLWLVNVMVESQKAQGCYSSGDRTCSLI